MLFTTSHSLLHHFLHSYKLGRLLIYSDQTVFINLSQYSPGGFEFQKVSY